VFKDATKINSRELSRFQPLHYTTYVYL